VPRYLIRREIPGAGKMSDAELAGASAQSCGVIREMSGLTWIHSYVAGDQVFCLYDAQSEAVLREHSEKSGFPANEITEIKRMIDPTWADA